jgi:hypothetical protein
MSMSPNGIATPLATQCSCRGCGLNAPEVRARITGSWSTRSGWVCPVCTRDQLHEIEAGIGRGR